MTDKVRVVWDRDVAKRLKKRVPSTMRRRIEKAVLKLAETGQGDVSSVVGSKGRLRLKVSTWRVIFRFEDDETVIVVTHIGPRGENYSKRVLR